MGLHTASFTGKVQKVDTFGNAVKVTLVNLPGKESGFEPDYMEAVFKADSYHGKLAATLKKDDDDVTISGRVMKKKWKNGNGFSYEIAFGELYVPWALRKREAAPGSLGGGKGGGVETAAAPQGDGGLDDIPF